MHLIGKKNNLSEHNIQFSAFRLWSCKSFLSQEDRQMNSLAFDNSCHLRMVILNTIDTVHV